MGRSEGGSGREGERERGREGEVATICFNLAAIIVTVKISKPTAPSLHLSISPSLPLSLSPSLLHRISL
jgi:hypothetical protein